MNESTVIIIIKTPPSPRCLNVTNDHLKDEMNTNCYEIFPIEGEQVLENETSTLEIHSDYNDENNRNDNCSSSSLRFPHRGRRFRRRVQSLSLLDDKMISIPSDNNNISTTTTTANKKQLHHTRNLSLICYQRSMRSHVSSDLDLKQCDQLRFMTQMIPCSATVPSSTPCSNEDDDEEEEEEEDAKVIVEEMVVSDTTTTTTIATEVELCEDVIRNILSFSDLSTILHFRCVNSTSNQIVSHFDSYWIDQCKYLIQLNSKNSIFLRKLFFFQSSSEQQCSLSMEEMILSDSWLLDHNHTFSTKFDHFLELNKKRVYSRLKCEKNGIQLLSILKWIKFMRIIYAIICPPLFTISLVAFSFICLLFSDQIMIPSRESYLVVFSIILILTIVSYVLCLLSILFDVFILHWKKQRLIESGIPEFPLLINTNWIEKSKEEDDNARYTLVLFIICLFAIPLNMVLFCSRLMSRFKDRIPLRLLSMGQVIFCLFYILTPLLFHLSSIFVRRVLLNRNRNQNRFNTRLIGNPFPSSSSSSNNNNNNNILNWKDKVRRRSSILYVYTHGCLFNILAAIQIYLICSKLDDSVQQVSSSSSSSWTVICSIPIWIHVCVLSGTLIHYAITYMLYEQERERIQNYIHQLALFILFFGLTVAMILYGIASLFIGLQLQGILDSMLFLLGLPVYFGTMVFVSMGIVCSFMSCYICFLNK